MTFAQTTETESMAEWTRDDGTATIRLRSRPDGQFAVRYDRLHQADDGRGYAYETFETRAAAEELVERWQANPPV